MDVLSRALGGGLVVLSVGVFAGCYDLEFDPESQNSLPVLTILEPQQGGTSGPAVVLKVEALDEEDGDLSAEVVWTESGQIIGRGTDVEKTFEVGAHTITAAVSDSVGAVAEETVTFQVAITE